MTARSGGCLCGKLRYTIEDTSGPLGACHCSMCKKFSGGIYLGIQVTGFTLEDDTTLSTYTSSPWAERGFCSTCGSSVFYRVTAEGPHHGAVHLAAGTLDTLDGLSLQLELFSDLRPDAYSFAGEARQMTQAAVEALFSDESTASTETPAT